MSAQGLYSAKVIHEKARIFFVQAIHADKPAWYYVRLNPEKVTAFKKKLGKEELDLPSYGKILFSGWGEAPAVQLRTAIESRIA